MRNFPPVCVLHYSTDSRRNLIYPAHVNVLAAWTDVPGEFLCLCIDTELLQSEVKYEAGEHFFQARCMFVGFFQMSEYNVVRFH